MIGIYLRTQFYTTENYVYLSPPPPVSTFQRAPIFIKFVPAFLL